ncbi:MAG: DegT/DnrJ/EryC1/StrS family aminotransferase [Candidatus Omnitrophica bacterium]|nr:DegT/DnrJ/EryC1/StrS family aminotransferase [Candidatus Omnitrophota bacterium]
MSIFREIPPTAGFPIYWGDLLPLLKFPKYAYGLEDDFKKYLPVNYARTAYSGTAAFYFILEGLKELSSKKTVIIPSFICPLVPLAIARAGLKVEVCDIVRDSFNFDLKQLEGQCCREDVLAVVPAHLAGLPLEFIPLEKIARKYGIFIIEDCAQSLGASYQGKKVGTLGDFGFFSLCRGKGLTIYEGGLLTAKEQAHAELIEGRIRELVKKDYFSEGLKILELFGYALFYRPFAFWFIFSLPQIFWKLRGNKLRAMIEDFNQDFATHEVSQLRKSIGHLSFYRLDEEIKRQREKADYYLEGLKGIKGVRAIKESGCGQGTYPFLTLLFDDPVKRNRFLDTYENCGLGVSIIYTSVVSGYSYLKEVVPQKAFPAGSFLAERHLTLSTSTFLKRKDQDRLLEIIGNCV